MQVLHPAAKMVNFALWFYFKNRIIMYFTRQEHSRSWTLLMSGFKSRTRFFFKHAVFCQVCIPDYVQVTRLHRDKSSLRLFQSNTYSTVVKISEWMLIDMNFITSKCTWHWFCEVRQGGSRGMPLFEIVKFV